MEAAVNKTLQHDAMPWREPAALQGVDRSGKMGTDLDIQNQQERAFMDSSTKYSTPSLPMHSYSFRYKPRMQATAAH